MALERKTQVEQRRRKKAPVFNEHGNQKPSDAAIAVKEGVNRLELHVGQPSPNQRWQRIAGVYPALKGGQGARDGIRRGRHETGVARARSANPVLARSDVPRLLVGPTNTAKQSRMDVAEQANAYRKALGPGEFPST
jgi:hypothetical protein